LQEVAQALSLRSAIHREFGIVDVDLQFNGEKAREARVREIQHVAWTADEVDEVIYKA
jgi:hypothetical protein